MSARSITMVTYHYVRDLPRTQYPRIKALLTSDFEQQLAYLTRFYRFVTVQDCLGAIYGGAELPANSALLTFDDGYMDHYQTVLPMLVERGIQGAFFPPAEAVMTEKVLSVNKIHLILAATLDHDALLEELLPLLDALRPEFGYEDNEALFQRLAIADRFDTAKIVFIKRVLQKGLPTVARDRIVDILFARHVSTDEAAVSRELYVSRDQLRTMAQQGMYIGNHGFNHVWLGEMPRAAQVEEIDRSLEFHAELGLGGTKDWVMCYPYGSYDDSLLSVIRERGCKLGLSSRMGVARLDRENAFTLERLDTNDLPKAATAAPSRWTEQVVGSEHG
ncbi:MAG: polysaccharide deacetylase family protein [Deltaproteobacteria bacterium]|nr:polysaccharide deacetylase family protein [Deltaproteobacteria bacterium]